MFFIRLFTICTSSLEKCLFLSFVRVLSYLLLLDFICSLYILNTVLSQIGIFQVFSPSLWLVFSFLNSIFPKSKNNLILEQSSLLNFSFMAHGGCDPSEIICQI